MMKRVPFLCLCGIVALLGTPVIGQINTSTVDFPILVSIDSAPIDPLGGGNIWSGFNSGGTGFAQTDDPTPYWTFGGDSSTTGTAWSMPQLGLTMMTDLPDSAYDAGTVVQNQSTFGGITNNVQVSGPSNAQSIVDLSFGNGQNWGNTASQSAAGQFGASTQTGN